MNVIIPGMPRTLTAAHPSSAPAPSAAPAAAGDSVTLSGASAPAVVKGEAPATAPPEGTHLSVPMRITASLLIGVMGAMALTGCDRAPAPAHGSSTSQAQTVADQKLAGAFDRAEQAIAAAKGGDAQATANKVTRELLAQVRDYARTTGKSAAEVSEKIKDYAIEHPAVSITILLAAGVTSGVVLEKYGVPQSIATAVGEAVSAATSSAGNGLSAVKEQVKAHPFIATAVGVAVAATVSYLVYQAVTPATPAPVPQTPQQKAFVQSLDALEREASTMKSGDVQKDAASVSTRFMERVEAYARDSGRSAREVADDVGAWMASHPAVSAAVVLAAGTGAGIVLERAGVPDKIGAVAVQVLESGKSGLGEVATAIKNHPVLSATIGTAVAAGAGYVIYEHVKDAPAAH